MTLRITHGKKLKPHQRTVKFETFEPPADATCPITQDPIAESQLDFMKGQVFSLAKPTHTGVRLECRHEFSAMCLLYHWTRNSNVLCPVCRNGPKGARVNKRELPAHFRIPMRRRVRKEAALDHEEHIRENEEAARQFDFGHWFVTFLEENPCHCTVLGSDMRGLAIQMTPRLENNVCYFTGECDEEIMRSKDSVRIIGLLVNAYHCQTRFPESAWTALDNSVTSYNLSAGSSSIQYLMSFDGGVAKIMLTMPIFLFQIFADQHENVYSLAISNWVSSW
jgi:hypothetical protein